MDRRSTWATKSDPAPEKAEGEKTKQNKGFLELYARAEKSGGSDKIKLDIKNA